MGTDGKVPRVFLRTNQKLQETFHLLSPSFEIRTALKRGANIMEDKKLARRIRSIQRKIDSLEKLKSLLERNPDLVPRTHLKDMGTGAGLEFEERGFIRPMLVDGKPILVLERWIPDEGWSEEQWKHRFVSMEDVSLYVRETLVKTILDGIKVDLNKAPYHYLDEDDEEEATPEGQN
jgi:hypothetical protein